MKRLGWCVTDVWCLEGGVLGWGVDAPRERKGGTLASLCVLARIEGSGVRPAARELHNSNNTRLCVFGGKARWVAEEGGCCARGATNLQNQG
jgi:hypothetical protein